MLKFVDEESFWLSNLVKGSYSSMRMNHAKMGCKRVIYFMISFFVCFVLVASSVGSKARIDEGKEIQFPELNPELVELIWTNCRQELMHAKDGVKGLELFVPEEPCEKQNEIISKSRSQNKVDMEKVLNVCDPQVQQTILHCLKEKNLMFLIFGEEKGPRSHCTKYPDLSISTRETPQRHDITQGNGITPSPASPSSTSKVPNYSLVRPTTVRHLSESQNPPKKKNVKKKEETFVKKKDHYMTIVIAIVLILVITLSIVGLFLLCCCKALKSSSGGKKDDRPLLSVSLSDYSSASSNSYYYGASLTKKNGNQSFSDASNHEEVSDNVYKANSLKDSKVEIPLEVANGTAIGPPSAVPRSAGLPPLKPPPGRSELSKPPSGRPARPPTPPPDVSDAPQPPPPPLPTKSPSGLPAPPPPPFVKRGPPPPPPPRAAAPPPPPLGLKAPRPPTTRQGQQSTSAVVDGGGADASKTKLKPFFWDKVPTNPDESMVWNQLKAGSFQFNEEMIETLFGYAPAEKNNQGSKKPSTSQDNANESIQIIEPKKAQNLAILLKALNVTTEEVCDALQEGNELPSGLLQTFLKMAPTPEEELKLRLYNGEVSRLGNAERFLKVVIEIPFAFMRIESLLFMCTLQEEEALVRESFTTLAAACTELRKNRLFLKLLEAVLKTGNRMNDGTFRGGAQAFKLDTLLKLSDVKGKDGKTTLLHFVVQEIIRTEGIRAFRATRDRRSFSSIQSDDVLLEDSSENSEDYYRELGLEVVSNIGKDLESVKRAAILDSDGLTGTVAKFGNSLIKSRNFLNSEMKNVDEDNGFNQVLKSFVKDAEVGIMQMLEEEKRIMALVKSTADYFHGTAGKEEGLRIFVIVRDFLVLLDKVCREIKGSTKKSFQTIKTEDSAKSTQSQIPSSDPRQKLAPKITERRLDSSSSDEES